MHHVGDFTVRESCDDHWNDSSVNVIEIVDAQRGDVRLGVDFTHKVTSERRSRIRKRHPDRASQSAVVTSHINDIVGAEGESAVRESGINVLRGDDDSWSAARRGKFAQSRAHLEESRECHLTDKSSLYLRPYEGTFHGSRMTLARHHLHCRKRRDDSRQTCTLFRIVYHTRDGWHTPPDPRTRTDGPLPGRLRHFGGAVVTYERCESLVDQREIHACQMCSISGTRIHEDPADPIANCLV